eukprot:gene6889-4962_t
MTNAEELQLGRRFTAKNLVTVSRRDSQLAAIGGASWVQGPALPRKFFAHDGGLTEVVTSLEAYEQ